MEKDAFYFPHFCNARHDRKVRRVRKELGIEGYGIFFMLLETLREQADYRYPVEDIDLLAEEFGTSEQKLRAVISNYGLFQLDEDEHFFSAKLIVFLGPYLEGKERKRIGGIKGNLIKYGYFTKEDLEGKNADEIEVLGEQYSHGSHSDRLLIGSAPKGKERKGKERKGKERKVNDIPPVQRKGYGENKRVLLTDEQYASLVDKIGKSKLTFLIDRMDGYLVANGKSYKNYCQAIINWSKQDYNNSNAGSSDNVKVGMSFMEEMRRNLKNDK